MDYLWKSRANIGVISLLVWAISSLHNLAAFVALYVLLEFCSKLLSVLVARYQRRRCRATEHPRWVRTSEGNSGNAASHEYCQRCGEERALE